MFEFVKELRRTAAHSVPAILLMGTLIAPSADAFAQATLTAGSRRPFVTGMVPSVANGFAVGGVSVDTNGVIARANLDDRGKLRKARLQAIKKISDDVGQTSQLRKISLRGLERAISELRKRGRPATDEIQYLAGLQRIQYVFVYPERHDIVLAGFAERWKVDESGNVVGQTTGQPVLQLDDLVIALQTVRASDQTRISCSIDPTKEGVSRLRRLMKTRGLRMSRSTVARMEQTLGPQQISITGIEPTSHFARVMVAADFRMKRLAMNLERAPIALLPSYLQLLKSSPGRLPRNMMPRWWLAPNYEPILKSPDGLAWKLYGPGVQALTEDSVFAEDGLAQSGKAHPIAKRWADSFTNTYENLSAHLPIFGKLRNCIDLAVVATLIFRQELTAKAGYDMPILTNPKQIAVAKFPVPKSVDSKASFFKKGRKWVISVSGGIDIDPSGVLDQVEEAEELAVRPKHAVEPNGRWWWD